MTELEVVRIVHSTFKFRILELSIAWRRMWYGMYHEKTREKVRQRNTLVSDAINEFRKENRG